MIRFRRWASAVALVVLSSSAQAQFTAVVQPPGRRAPVTLDSAALRARQDSARGTASQQMHAWLDSVNRELGIDTVPHTEPNFFARSDSSRPAWQAPVASAPDGNRRDEVKAEPAAGDQAGMRAPDTATPLPTVALLGAGALALGLLLLGRRPAAPQTGADRRSGGR